jgi:predicted nucleic acid-binding protein
VLDTNVFISGVFFKGPPYQIIRAWRDGRIRFLMSEEIFLEYQRVGEHLASGFPKVDLGKSIGVKSSFLTCSEE